MPSDIYKEALADAKKLREVAEADARNRLIEKVSPLISEMVTKKIKEQTERVFIDEQEDDADLGLDAAAPALGDDTTVTAPGDASDSLGDGSLDTASAEVAPPVSEPAELDNGLGNQETAAPIEVGSAEDLINVSMPDEDGKITVDLEDLFAPDASAAAPAPAADMSSSSSTGATDVASMETGESSLEQDAASTATPAPALEDEPTMASLQPESVTWTGFNNHLNECSFKIDQVFHMGGTVNEIIHESLKNKLFTLVESLDSLKERGLVNSRQVQVNENKLEFLFHKLNESKKVNSYNTTSENHSSMKHRTLKEFAAELYTEETLSIAQDTLSTGKTGVPTDKDKEAHARKQSGVSPEIGGTPKDIQAKKEPAPFTDRSTDKAWEDGEASDESMIRENSAEANTDANDDIALGAAGFGDTNEEPAVEFEVSDAEITEAVRKMRKESIRRKYAKLREESSKKGREADDLPWEDGEPEGGKSETHESLKEQDEFFGGAEEDEDDAFPAFDGGAAGAPPAAPAAGGGDVTITVDLPDELAALMADLDASDIQVSASVGGAADAGSEDDEMIEIVDDEDDASPEGDDASMLLVDDEDEDVVAESRKRQRAYRQRQLAENARKGASSQQTAKLTKMVKVRNQKIQELTEALATQNLFTAKVVYLNKFLMREGLSKKALRQIVEHFDRAKTLAEAKTVYKTIKTRLDEHVVSASNLTGSASKATTSGSAKPLNENRTHSQDVNTQNDGDTSASVERWKKLAAIK